MKGRKAMTGGEMLLWAARFFLFILLLFSVVFLVRIYQQKEIDTSEIEAELFKNYLLYSPNALSYTDPYVNRVYLGVVDLKNFNSKHLESAADFGSPNSMVAANMSIALISAGKYTRVAQAYYNEEKFFDWLPLAHPAFKGRGTVYSDFDIKNVNYVDENGTITQGRLVIEILVPRT